MTKEELEKEAEEKYVEVDREFIACQDEGEVFNIGYVLGAEPREKRIAELEAQIEKMKNWCNCKNYQQCLIDLAEQGKGMKPSECCVNCKKWDMKENA